MLGLLTLSHSEEMDAEGQVLVTDPRATMKHLLICRLFALMSQEMDAEGRVLVTDHGCFVLFNLYGGLLH